MMAHGARRSLWRFERVGLLVCRGWTGGSCFCGGGGWDHRHRKRDCDRIRSRSWHPVLYLFIRGQGSHRGVKKPLKAECVRGAGPSVGINAST